MDSESLDMEQEGARSWRDILLTLALASAAVFFFVRQRTTPGAAQASLNDEERRRRRERLAAIAEERAATKMAQAAAGDGSVSVKKRTEPPKTIPVRDSEEIVDNRGSSADRKDYAEEGKHQHQEREDSKAAADETDVAIRETSERIQSVKDCGEGDPNSDNVALAVEPLSKEEATGAIDDRQISVDEGKDEDKQSQCENETDLDDLPADDAHDDNGNDAVIKESSNYDVSGADENARTTNEHEENTESSIADSNNTGDAESLSAESDSGHRERHAKAIAKIMAKKGKQVEKKLAADPTLTIYLILTSSPGSPRLELSIPAKLSASSLLRSASQASGVPEKELKLIFRGRIITEYSMTGHVIEEFGIENGSALHVVGKPQQSKEDEGGNDSEDEDVSDSGEEDSNESGGDGSSDSGEEDISASEDEAVDFSDARARAQVVAEIRRSTGEGIFHRAVQRGDLDALREAVDNGHSDLLRVADSNGWTPLHEAVRAGHVDIVEYLVREVGLNVEEVTNPLSLALEHHGRDHPILQILDPSAYNPWDDGEMYD